MSSSPRPKLSLAGLNGCKLHPSTVLPNDLTLVDSVDWSFDDALITPHRGSAARCQCRPTSDNSEGCQDDSCVNFACLEECGSACPHPRCGNQNIDKKIWRKLEIRPTPKKGHGLFALEDIPAKKFIVEYCGEVVGEKKLNQRFADYLKVNDRMLYVLELAKGIYIDARSKGGVARYINHCCTPNCTMEKWKVRGNYRMVVFALRDIKKDEELTFDYKWDRRKGRPLTKCHCESPECRGYLETEAVSVFEEVDEDGKKIGDWRRLKEGESGMALIGHTIKIYFEGNYSYLEAEVNDYNPGTGTHNVRYIIDDEVSDEKLTDDVFIYDETITNEITKKKGRTSISSRVNVYDGDEDRNETGAVISSSTNQFQDKTTNILYVSKACHEFIARKAIIPTLLSKYGVRAEQKLTKRSALTLDDLHEIADLNPEMTHFIAITFTGPGKAPDLALDSLKRWTEVYKAQLPPPAPIMATSSFEVPSVTDVFSPSQTSCHVCVPEESVPTLSMVVSRLKSQSVAIEITKKTEPTKSVHNKQMKLIAFTILSGSPDMEKWFQEQAYGQFKNDGECIMFGRDFMESWSQLIKDNVYIKHLAEAINAPVHITLPINQEKPMIWYGCNPKDIGEVHNGVIGRALDAVKGCEFLLAQPQVFEPIKGRLLEFLAGQATYAAPWLTITPQDGSKETAKQLKSIASACFVHQAHLASKSAAHPFFSSKPALPANVKQPDTEVMAAELVILGQVCLGGALKGALKRQNVHASSICGMFWSGGPPRAARILAITSLYIAHKSSSGLLTKPMRLHSLEDVVEIYYQTIYPNNVMDRQGEEMLDICKRVISLETEVAEKLSWRLGTAYGEWIWWKILEIETKGAGKELTQVMLNARAVATSGQVGSWNGGRFVAETDGKDLAVAAYAMFQFDDSAVNAVAGSLLKGSTAGAAKAFSGILNAVESRTTEKYKDHFLVKSLISKCRMNNPFLAQVPAAQTNGVKRAYVTGVTMQFSAIASNLGLTAVRETEDGGVTLVGSSRSIYVFVEKVNAALRGARPSESRLPFAQVVQIENYLPPPVTDQFVDSVISMPEECRIKPVASLPVGKLQEKGLFWASSNKKFAELDYTRNLLNFPQCFDLSNAQPILELAHYLEGTKGEADVKLLRVPGRKVSEREEMRLKQMKCRGKVGISPAVLKDLQMMEWMEAGGYEDSFVLPLGLVHGRGKTDRDDKKKKIKDKGEGEEKKSEEEDNLLSILDFSSDEEDEDGPSKRASLDVDHISQEEAEGDEQPKKKSRKSHAADPDHPFHLITTDEWVVSMKDFRKVFTRRRAKESKSRSGNDYDPPMAVSLSVVRSMMRNLFQIASGCHSIGCALGNNKSTQTYFNFETFLVNEAGELKLSSLSACCPMNRSDTDLSGLNDIKLKKKGTKDEQKNLKKALDAKFGKDKLLYASPEILLGSQRVTPASDVWAVGALGLQLLLGKATFNLGAGGRTDTLVNITKLAGTISETSNNFGKGKLMPFFKKYEQYMDKKNTKEAASNGGKKKKYKQDMGKGLKVMSKLQGQEYDQFFDFMDKLLKMDPEQRPSAVGALLHPFFKEDDHPEGCSKAAREWIDVRKFLGKRSSGAGGAKDYEDQERGEKRKAEGALEEEGEEKKGRLVAGFDEDLIDNGDDIYGGL
ncbi:hypothetical protein TrST_g4568 [Triparma strigata]|uniref:Uncharacterized protein n=1 Tax=Triparma strigata TaxID=1606541 RepID=A0A9W7EIW2_9STRA|nr:hypothetical protein TrST_g4568 [Triparma strigata]